MKGPNRFSGHGKFKKVLCVCEMNLLRSPSAQIVLGSAPFNYDTRSAGTNIAALIKLRPTLINWANEIVCMEAKNAEAVYRVAGMTMGLNITILEIPDVYPYRDSFLMALIAERYRALSK